MYSLHWPHEGLIFWAIPSWIVALILSGYFRPAIAFAGMIGAFFVTLLFTGLFSFRELFTTVQGVVLNTAEVIAGLILTGVITPAKWKKE